MPCAGANKKESVRCAAAGPYLYNNPICMNSRKKHAACCIYLDIPYTTGPTQNSGFERERNREEIHSSFLSVLPSLLSKREHNGTTAAAVDCNMWYVQLSLRNQSIHSGSTCIISVLSAIMSSCGTFRNRCLFVFIIHKSPFSAIFRFFVCVPTLRVRK